MLLKRWERYGNPRETMALSRIMLLITGIVSSIAVVTVMLISAEGAMASNNDLLAQQQSATQQVISPEQMISAYESSFPMQVAGTSLVAQALAIYDGQFLEDGFDREVIDVIALEVQNTGDRDIRKVHIELKLQNTTLNFLGEYIPSGETALLVERNCRKRLQGEITDCVGWQFLMGNSRLTRQEVSVQDRGLGTIVVTNLTEKTIYNICIYHKAWLESPGIYVGGSAHKTKIQQLKPGEEVCLQPEHYAVGYSRVVAITGDTMKQ